MLSLGSFDTLEGAKLHLAQQCLNHGTPYCSKGMGVHRIEVHRFVCSSNATFVDGEDGRRKKRWLTTKDEKHCPWTAKIVKKEDAKYEHKCNPGEKKLRLPHILVNHVVSQLMVTEGGGAAPVIDGEGDGSAPLSSMPGTAPGAKEGDKTLYKAATTLNDMIPKQYIEQYISPASAVWNVMHRSSKRGKRQQPPVVEEMPPGVYVDGEASATLPQPIQLQGQVLDSTGQHNTMEQYPIDAYTGIQQTLYGFPNEFLETLYASVMLCCNENNDPSALQDLTNTLQRFISEHRANTDVQPQESVPQ